MKNIRFLIFSSFFLAFLFPQIVSAADTNDLAYENRIHLDAGTIWNVEGKGDCLIYPYFDVRKVDGNRQVTQLTVENFGEYGIAARLRFRDWGRGREIFSKDIWIPSKGIWTARVEINGDGSNAVITGSGDVIWRSDGNHLYLTNSLMNGVAFSIRNIRKGAGESTLYGFIELIGEEKTAPSGQNGKAGRLASIERDCPNTLKGSLSITRVEDGTTMAYDAVAIGNFSRGQGSLFRSPGSPYPRLDNCEDSLDQLEFQLSKFEIYGPFSVSPAQQEKTSLIVTFPTKHFHYSNTRRLTQINNPFEGLVENKGEDLKTALSNSQGPLPADSEIVLPYAVNVIGLYRGSGQSPTGIDHLSMPTYSYESGEVTLTSNNVAQRILIQDYEYFREMFTTYRGLPSLALVLREYRSSDVLHTSIVPAEFSAVWEASNLESILFPTFVSGPSFGEAGKTYTFTTGGASSTVGHPVQYQFDWGDGTATDWLDVGVVSADKSWSGGGIFAVSARARCALHTDLVSKWSKNFLVMIESVSSPPILSGPTAGIPNTLYTYTTGGSASSIGHPVQYLFDWGDDTDSNWLPYGVTSATKSWPNGGQYTVRTKARCMTDPLVVSDFNAGLTVRIEVISAPTTLTGPTEGVPGVSYTFTTGGASSNIGDPIEYQFEWGDGTFSAWQASTSATKAWATGKYDGYRVKVRARCAVHTFLVSATLESTVKIEAVKAPSIPVQQPSGTGKPGNTYAYRLSGANSSINDPIQYFVDWGDGTNTGWLPTGTTEVQKLWPQGGIFNVRAKARCSIHTQIESDWSPALEVGIEVVTPPYTPDGVTTVTVGESQTYTTGGGESNIGDPLQYRFFWGDDDTYSAWSDTPSASKTWRIPGTHIVRAQARCKTHTNIESDWSDVLEVTVQAPPP